MRVLVTGHLGYAEGILDDELHYTSRSRSNTKPLFAPTPSQHG
jgi:hypothetical protein